MAGKKNKQAYSAYEKRAYYIGYGMGLAGHSITEDRVQDVVVKQRTNAMQVSMISGVMDAGVHRTRKKRRK